MTEEESAWERMRQAVQRALDKGIRPRDDVEVQRLKAELLRVWENPPRDEAA